MQNAYPLDLPLWAESKSSHNWWDVTPVGDGLTEDGDAEATTGSGLFSES